MPYIPKSLLKYIRESILTLSIEVCGYLVFSQTGEVSIDQAASGNIEDARPHCTLPRRGKYTWHSHFLMAKSYPSAEDILSIMKKRDNPAEQGEMELIFTRWGIWQITSAEKDRFRDVPAQLAYLTERGNDIYRACNGAKTDFYNMEAIRAILDRTMNHYKRLGLVIKFSPWADEDYIF